VANPYCAARAVGSRVFFQGGEISALVAGPGEVLRVSEADRVSVGLAQVRRVLERELFGLVHVVFAPAVPRPLLLALVRLRNRSQELVQLDYSELWDLPGGALRVYPGACERTTPAGDRALADAGMSIRAHTPDPPPRDGLALTLRLVLPPDSQRELAFAYAAPDPGEPAAAMVQAWRGDVAGELARTVRRWQARFPAPNTLDAYRVEVSSWSG
jgi:hypothetical protein